ncbi:MAG: flagellin FliC [Deltaproteobacteria bacterium]|nr:flagellin FliC [Deltaproteobacteria bacterium]
MALTVNTNVASINAQRNLSRTSNALNSSLSRLSSGLRINSAADDAAGLAISENMKSQIRSMSQAERNANDGISLIQTAEGAESQMSDILGRMRELSVQSANGTLGSTERGFLDKEFKSLVSEVDRISAVTEFNGTKLLDATATTANLQVGFRNTANDQIAVALEQVDSSTLGVGSIGGGAGGGTALSAALLDTAANASIAIGIIDASITDVSTARAGLGATQNRLQITVSNLQSSRENLSAANSRIRDVDIAKESANLTKQNILMQAGVSVLAQANQAPALALSLL